MAPSLRWNPRVEFEDAMTKASGPLLRKSLTMLMKIPKYRDTHATDDHIVSAMFVGGLVGDAEDQDTPVEFGAEDWELTNMCNTQFTFG
ncbi:catalytic LigB subunit of aromatic ring-opening dioxygenase [Penicillium soppii]|uniref:catalytic LigB subunit of aromatic ring-opening dioxygenase n=1 Tax=Penicillium soppii TaxID=69789 RepID=UPI0025465826|nr:catalytic LigB subunit of aromatic ring-opening dioxygenase [Penicillium soppii]KAJ5876262.1 catalytic LigB subunit of aromatic ring-opening dioxygenase [Penicillium soppii]